jgi:hypothetical protein
MEVSMCRAKNRELTNKDQVLSR